MAMHRSHDSRTAAHLEEASRAFSDLDAYVQAIVVSTDDDGTSAIEEMRLELRTRADRFANNKVVQSTADGLEKAYRLAILQRVIDMRFAASRRL